MQTDATGSLQFGWVQQAHRISERVLAYEVLFDSGVRSGPDVACALASGARFAFMGRSFMYAICAMGAKGGPHVMAMLMRQLTQVMEQLGCERMEHLPRHLAPRR